MLTEKDYCDYDTCVALCELGMRITSRKAYSDRDTLKHSSRGVTYTVRTASAMGWVIAIPLYEVQKWLREEKKIYVEPYYAQTINHMPRFRWMVTNGNSSRFLVDTLDSREHYHSYEEALSEGLRQAIKILKER